MTCTMPKVQLPRDFEVHEIIDHHMSVSAGDSVVLMRGGSDDHDRDYASLYVGLQFDDYYLNLTAANPDITFQFFQQPSFDTPPDVIFYRPDSFDYIEIEVSHSLFCQRE